MDPAFLGDVMHLLRVASSTDGGVIYRNVSLHGQEFSGLDLVWDGPDRIVAIAVAKDSVAVSTALYQFKLLESSLAVESVLKKMHLILFHSVGIGRRLEGWPAGLTINLIPVSNDVIQQRMSRDIGDKLLGLLLIDRNNSAPAMQSPPEWRHFLTPERVNKIVARLTDNETGQGLDRSSLGSLSHELLSMAHHHSSDVLAGLYDYLDKCWEGKRGAN